LRGISSQAIVGRDAELRRLDDALNVAANGEPRIVALAGEAGVGKTRLAAELETRARERGFTVLHGECVEFGGEEFAYAPFVAALRDVPDAWAEARGADDRPFSPRHGQGRLCERVLALLGRLAAAAPLLLVLEDMHWADRSSRDLVAFLARNLRGEAIAVALTYRTGELPQAHPMRRLLTELVRRPPFALVDVAPLSRADVARQLEAIAGGPVQAAVAARVYERSGGNPFFVEELFAADLEHVPATLADTVMLRVDRVSEPAQRLLAAVAAAGGRAEHDVVLAVTDGEAAGAGVREAVDAGLLMADGRGVALRHGLIGEVVYGTLVPAERRELHHALATALAADGAPAAQLAYQWQQAGAHDAALAASVDAGLDAARVYAFAEAWAHFERALALWDAASEHPTDRVDLLSRTAQAARYAGDRERAVTFGRQALAELDETAEPVRAARLYERLGEYASWDDRAALDCYERALALLPDGPGPERARLLAAQGHALMGLRRWPEARDRCEAALAIGDDVQAAAAGLTLGLVLAFLGDAAAGEARLRAALRAATDLGAAELAARAYVHLGELLRLRGAHADALAAMLEGERFAVRHGMRGSFGTFMFVNAAGDLLRLGRWDEAAERLAAAERLELGTTAAAMHLATAAMLHALRGEPGAARAHLERSAALTAEDLPGEFVIPIRCAEATLALAEHSPEQVRRLADETLDGERDPLYAPALYALAIRAEAEMPAPDPGRAGRLLAELDRLLDTSAPVPDALAHRATGYAECDRSDADRWAAAAARWDALGEPHPVAYARLRQAEALLAARGDRTQATTLLTAALATAAALGAAPLRADVEALARRAHLRLGAVDERAAAPAESDLLTPREIEVLRLLADGLTNRQIAERLFISEKTVGTHVAHVFEKLDVHSRVGAAGRAQALGVLTST
jgi:DNA-binding CsgD family transcriptional regulator